MGSTLANYWHPIARSEDVIEQPRSFTLLDEPLVAFRASDGIRVFKDLCIHRGVALSLGSIEAGVLRCAYHGWAYDADGACIDIPSLPPGSSIPPKARAIRHMAEERYGLVWVALDQPVASLPDFPSREWVREGYRIFVSHQYRWKTSAGRAVENFMDISHFPFVHEGILGSRDNTIVQEHEVQARDHGLYYYLEAPEPASLHSGENEMIRWEYFLYPPFTIHLKKTVPGGNETLISMSASPTSSRITELFLWLGRSFQTEPKHDQEFIDFTHEIMEQDREVVESQRPEEIPVDLREELHLKVPDASGIAYRKLLGQIADMAPYMP